MSEKKVVVTQIRSAIRNSERQKRTLQALGLGKIGRAVSHVLTPSTAGMIASVQNLVIVEEQKN